MKFKENKHWKYRFTLLEDFKFSMDTGVNPKLFCFHANKIFLTVDGNEYTIKSGYSWNGCSPKLGVPIIGWIGTPDYPETIEASLVHDALYQFHKELPIKKKEADLKFLQIMSKNNFKFAEIYYRAVVIFGKFGRKNENTYSRHD